MSAQLSADLLIGRELPQGEVCETANRSGHNMAGADRPKDRVELPNKPLMRRVKANDVPTPPRYGRYEFLK